MTELAIHEEHAPSAEIATRAGNEAAVPGDMAVSPLVLWAFEAKQASQIATSLARTSFVPSSLRSKVQPRNAEEEERARQEEVNNITAAILAGMELGLKPMATMRSIDIVQGTPGLRAHAMRALVQSHGHDVEVVSASPTKVVMRGRRAGSETWQPVEWTIERAQQLGITGRDQWRKQPQTMLIARATGEVCRLIASDVLYAMPYAAEELDQDGRRQDGSLSAAPRVTAAEIMRNADGGRAPAPARAADSAPVSEATVFERLSAEISWARTEGDLEELHQQAAASRDAGEITDEQFAELDAQAAAVAAQFADGA